MIFFYLNKKNGIIYLLFRKFTFIYKLQNKNIYALIDFMLFEHVLFSDWIWQSMLIKLHIN